jgi:hypothetical protein
LGQESATPSVLWTEDVDAAYAMLVAKGAPSVSPPYDFLGSLRAAWAMDPDGNPVEIVSRLVVTKKAGADE